LLARNAAEKEQSAKNALPAMGTGRKIVKRAAAPEKHDEASLLLLGFLSSTATLVRWRAKA